MPDKKLTLTFHSDPGHGWLAVPLKMLRDLGVAGKISRSSYRRGPMAYLEEDGDAAVFVEAAKAAGMEIKVVEKQEDPTPIRGYPSYSRPADS